MISKGEAAKKNSEIHAHRIAAAEKVIDRALSEDYTPGRDVNIAGSLLNLDYHQRENLMTKYRRAGWSVRHISDQRDGDYFSFS
jgi:hypothetical protein